MRIKNSYLLKINVNYMLNYKILIIKFALIKETFDFPIF